MKELVNQNALTPPSTPLQIETLTPNAEISHQGYVPGLVSIIMPAHNRESVISESIQSVLIQTYQDWELIIVDDASTDRTLSVVHGIADQDARIRVIPLSENGGVANARNVGISAARGQYLAFLDSDDLWLRDKLRAQVEFMQQKDSPFSFCRYRRFTDDGAIGKPIQIPETITYEKLLKHNVIGCLTVLIDRGKVLPFTMTAGGHEDYFTWLQILKRGHIAHGLQKDLARYRLSPKSVSANKLNSALLTWRIYRNHERLSLGTALWCFVNYMVRSLFSRLPTIRSGT